MPISKQRFYDRLKGPVCPILVPFTEDGRSVDHDALALYVSFLVNSGVSAVMTTVGTSRFNLLDDNEILAVNATVAKAAQDKSLVILAGPMTGSTTKNIEFAHAAADQGADAYIAFFPERHYGDEQLFQFFESLATSTTIGIMMHQMPMRSGYGGNQHYSLDLMTRLSQLPTIFGMKEESMDPAHSYKIHRHLGEELAIIGAGSMKLFMRDYHAGARAYLVGIGSFFPNVARAFYDAMVTGDFAVAHKIVRTYEEPYFDLAVSLGWHIALKETLNILGLMPAWERAPLPRLNSDQRKILLSKVEELGWTEYDPLHLPS